MFEISATVTSEASAKIISEKNNIMQVINNNIDVKYAKLSMQELAM